ncbi:MAG: glutamate-5-semialdehyde dehydrogenase [Lachnospiraceae bacterium]|nr:glutamate-5-semialdehyde dehydrogenase [Lachnospiraceae bacterium]
MTQIDINRLGKQAKEAKYELSKLSTEQKNTALCQIAKDLLADTQQLLHANEKDLENAKKNGMNPGMIDRLRLTEERIQAIAQGILKIVELQDPIGEIIESKTLENGLQIEKRRVPLGVIGIIYESRPNVTADAFGLCFKTGNAVILKGGSDAIYSNIAITESIRNSLGKCGITKDAIQIIQATDRAVTEEFMKCKEYVDVLIPRGGAGLIRSVVEKSEIPVIETGTGNCHIYIDEFADPAKAVPIIVNAKTQRIGVCNACESLVVHEKCIGTILPMVAAALKEKNVELRGDEEVCACIDNCVLAESQDYGKEYLDLIISIKTVKSIEEAITHINQYSTGHSEAIITENKQNAEKFLNEIDSACVYVNASTRFTDGFEFGMGAEIGISTQKLHARGPMGLKELTTYKYAITGDGQIRN